MRLHANFECLGFVFLDKNMQKSWLKFSKTLKKFSEFISFIYGYEEDENGCIAFEREIDLFSIPQEFIDFIKEYDDFIKSTKIIHKKAK